MASLEHINVGGRDSFRVRFQIGKKRYSVGLSNLDKADAQIAREHIEHLVDRHQCQRPPSIKTMHWVDALPSEIHDKLSTAGLVEPRKLVDLPRSLIAFMNAYVDQRTDWKKPENYRQAINHLKTFLKKDVSLTALTVADVERWLGWMTNSKKGPRLSSNTAGQHVKRCRHMMRQAIKEKLATENPFADVKIDLRSDCTKDYEVTTADSTAILDACPDQEWRVIFALNRYGGLRCPSEVLRVKWSDIAWDRERLKVSSPKTARYGKVERVIPLFPELRAELEALQEICAASNADDPKSQYVIRRYRHSETNLRTAFGRILDRAGVVRFAKPFMNCRTTRRNELERQGVRNAALNAWFGHSRQTAEKHYERVTDDDYAAVCRQSAFVGHAVGQSTGIPGASTQVMPCVNPVIFGLLRELEAGRLHLPYTPLDSNQ